MPRYRLMFKGAKKGNVMYIVKKDGMTMINLDYVREIAVSENRIVYRTEDEKVKVLAIYKEEIEANAVFSQIVVSMSNGCNIIDLSLVK